jgi:hypothetical protein
MFISEEYKANASYQGNDLKLWNGRRPIWQSTNVPNTTAKSRMSFNLSQSQPLKLRSMSVTFAHKEMCPLHFQYMCLYISNIV